MSPPPGILLLLQSQTPDFVCFFEFRKKKQLCLFSLLRLLARLRKQRLTEAET
jgi:hypothetical protein